jgi:hypothetical protein
MKHRPRLWLATLLTALAVALARPPGTGAYSLNCPVGQIPNWNNNACVPVQQPVSVPSGLTTQQSVMPQSGPNGAPALRSCNGSPTPIGQPCPGDPLPQPSAKTSQPAITVSAAPAGGPVVGAVTQSNVSLQSLLGDWYTGWMSYFTSSLNWSDSNSAYVASIFATIPSCVQGQQQACEQAIWQQILPWYLLLVPGASVSVTTPAPPPQTPAAAGPASTVISPAAASIQSLLGDWYSGWLSYVAGTLGWSDAQTSAADAYLAGAAACAGGQAAVCQAFVMQQFQTWLAPAPAPADSGS